MTPGSTSYENILEVENQGSQLSRFFQDPRSGADHTGVLYRSGRNRPIQHSDVLTEWLLAA